MLKLSENIFMKILLHCPSTLSGFINKMGAYTLRRQILLPLSVCSLVTGISVLLHIFVLKVIQTKKEKVVPWQKKRLQNNLKKTNSDKRTFHKRSTSRGFHSNNRRQLADGIPQRGAECIFYSRQHIPRACQEDYAWA